MKWHGEGLVKNVYFILFWTYFQTFLLYNWILLKKNPLLEICNFFVADSKKVKHKSFQMIICHIWTSNM